MIASITQALHGAYRKIQHEAKRQTDTVTELSAGARDFVVGGVRLGAAILSGAALLFEDGAREIRETVAREKKGQAPR